jgi:MYXO-CTERM domain-containing protein
MNIVSGATGSSGGGVAGWDINPYTATAGADSGFHLWGPDTTTWLDYNNTNTFNLPVGTPIGPGGSFERPGGGQNLNTQINLNSNNNFFGFEFVNENGGGTHYGFIQVAFGATIGTRSIVAYAYDDVAGAPITTFAVPAPGALALLGLAGLVGSRRRRVA